ncbi:hypothetical protein BSKO_08514 [Bryopsis sp. KO-2023]|nr:hypothetical protein BSKO_08514 [Bryopsis sp. KO-2023]
MTFSTVVVVILLFAPASILGGVVPHKFCKENEVQSFEVLEMSIEPESPRAGDAVKILLKGNNTVPIVNGDLSYLVEFKDVDLVDDKEELCKRADCPLPVGIVEIDSEQKLPAFTPPGTYDLRLQGISKEGDLLFCIDIDLKVKILDVGKAASKAAKSALKSIGIGRKLL